MVCPSLACLRAHYHLLADMTRATINLNTCRGACSDTVRVCRRQRLCLPATRPFSVFCLFAVRASACRAEPDHVSNMCSHTRRALLLLLQLALALFPSKRVLRQPGASLQPLSFSLPLSPSALASLPSVSPRVTVPFVLHFALLLSLLTDHNRQLLIFISR